MPSLNWTDSMLNWTCFASYASFVDALSGGACDVALAGLPVSKTLLDRNLTFAWPVYTQVQLAACAAMHGGTIRAGVAVVDVAPPAAGLGRPCAAAPRRPRPRPLCSNGKTIAVLTGETTPDIWAFLSVFSWEVPARVLELYVV